MGYLVLQGGAEFGGAMKSSDLRAIELAGGFNAPMSIIPAAAAADHNHERAGRVGADWFKSLGAGKVTVLPLIDRASSEDRQIAERLHQSGLIYMLGGFPRYLADVLQDSRAGPHWTTVRWSPEAAPAPWCCASFYMIRPSASSARGWAWWPRHVSCRISTTSAGNGSIHFKSNCPRPP